MKKCLIIYSERPSHSHLKELLSKSIGDEEAEGICSRMTFNLLFEMIHANFVDTQLEVWGLSPADVPYFSEAFPEVRSRLQIGGSLSDRLATSFERCFQSGVDAAVIISGNTIGLNRQLIEEAFIRLNSNQLVIGPSFSEGLYLIGMSSPGLPVFTGLDDDSGLLPKIINNIEVFNIEPKILPQLHTIEMLEDLEYTQRRRT